MSDGSGWRELDADLDSRLRGRRLVVEIGLTARLQEQVEVALGRLIRSDTRPDDVARQAPALLAVGLVAHGVYRYEQGNYWDGFPLAGIDQRYGPAFEKAITRLGLELFTEMVEQENASRYVARILAHGGIPKYCLEDYFKLLQQGLRSGSEDAADLLTRWRSRRNAFVGVDLPVKRFLLFGRSISRDYLDRSIDLYREWNETKSFPTPEAAGLPVAVITELRRLAERGSVGPEVRRRTAGSVRPTLTCDPWNALGPTVILPAARNTGASATWTVATDSDVHRQPVASAADLSVPVGPSREWEVTLTDGGTLRTSAVFEGLDEVPALFFSPRTGGLITSGLGLTAEDVWVLRPSDKDLAATDADGNSAQPRVIEVLPEPTGDWSGYVYEHIDLADCTELRVGSQSDHRTVTLRSADRPELDGTFLPPTVTGDGMRICVAQASLRVPPGALAWTIRVSVDGQVHIAETAAGTTFDLGRFLPTGHAALVSISARGVLGSDLRDEFCWVPGLDIQAPDRLALPADPAPTVLVESPGVALVGHDAKTMTLRPDPGRDAVDTLVAGAAEPVTVSIQLPVLRWGPVVSGHMSFGARVLPLSTLDFTVGTAPALAVSTGRPGTKLVLTVEAAGRQVQSWDPVNASGSRGQFRYDLARIADTIRTHEEVLHLVLLLGELGTPIRLATISPQFEFTDLQAAALHDGHSALVSVTFVEHLHANGRVLRLWHRNRPWEDPISAPLPDEAAAGAELVFEPCPPLGEYLAELVVDDGFSVPMRPGANSATVASFALGDETEVLVDLSARAETDPVAVVESILATGRPARQLDEDEFGDIVVPALSAWAVLDDLPSPNGQELRSIDRLEGLLGAAAPFLGSGIEVLADEDALGPDDLLRLAIRLAPRIARRSLPAGRTAWRLEPALACLLELGPERTADEDASSEFIGWSPDEELDEIDEADESGRVSQLWLGMDYQTLELIRTMLQFEVRPRPLSEDGRIAATFEWLKANAGDEPHSVERWRAAHHRLRYRPVPISDAVDRHLSAREPAHGAESWGDFARLTLIAALHVCGRTTEEPEAQRALLNAASFAPQQIRRDLMLAWILTDDILRDHDPNDMPTEVPT